MVNRGLGRRFSFLLFRSASNLKWKPMILYLRDAIPNLDHLRSSCNPCNCIINCVGLEPSVKNMILEHSENLLIQLEHELVLRVDIEFLLFYMLDGRTDLSHRDTRR